MCHHDSPKKLVGGFNLPTPLKNDGSWFVSWDDSIPNCFWKVMSSSHVPVTTIQFIHIWVCLKMSCTPLYPMVLLIIIPMKNGELSLGILTQLYPTFSDKPIYLMVKYTIYRKPIGWSSCFPLGIRPGRSCREGHANCPETMR